MKYVYLNAKTGEKKSSDKPITDKGWVLIRQVGKIIKKT